MRIYLAIPYSFNPELSFEIANEVTAMLMEQGHEVFSPISHSHHVSDYLPPTIRTDSIWWRKQNFTFINWCEEIYTVVIGEEGTALIENSVGVQDEWEEGKRLKKHFKLIQYHV